ncbi:hypothetical protein H9P43_004492 [Blastocladiella emersonii ATCC 22665]|nr:hypothetical protein H9P43_004492 [Blastocladiella emersonii ATCC 22665]
MADTNPPASTATVDAAASSPTSPAAQPGPVKPAAADSGILFSASLSAGASGSSSYHAGDAAAPAQTPTTAAAFTIGALGLGVEGSTTGAQPVPAATATAAAPATAASPARVSAAAAALRARLQGNKSPSTPPATLQAVKVEAVEKAPAAAVVPTPAVATKVEAVSPAAPTTAPGVPGAKVEAAVEKAPKMAAVPAPVAPIPTEAKSAVEVSPAKIETSSVKINETKDNAAPAAPALPAVEVAATPSASPITPTSAAPVPVPSSPTTTATTTAAVLEDGEIPPSAVTPLVRLYSATSDSLSATRAAYRATFPSLKRAPGESLTFPEQLWVAAGRPTASLASADSPPDFAAYATLMATAKAGYPAAVRDGAPVEFASLAVDWIAVVAAAQAEEAAAVSATASPMRRPTTPTSPSRNYYQRPSSPTSPTRRPTTPSSPVRRAASPTLPKTLLDAAELARAALDTGDAQLATALLVAAESRSGFLASLADPAAPAPSAKSPKHVAVTAALVELWLRLVADPRLASLWPAHAAHAPLAAAVAGLVDAAGLDKAAVAEAQAKRVAGKFRASSPFVTAVSGIVRAESGGNAEELMKRVVGKFRAVLTAAILADGGNETAKRAMVELVRGEVIKATSLDSRVRDAIREMMM